MDITKLESIKKITYSQIYGYSKYEREYGVYVSEHHDVLSGVESFKNSIKQRKVTSFEGKKVYFMKNVTFSRDAFLRKHKGSKLSRIENADIIITDIDKLPTPHVQKIRLSLCDNMKYYLDGSESGHKVNSTTTFYQIGYSYHSKRDNEITKQLGQLYKYSSNACIIDVSSVLLPSSTELDIDLFKKVINMLSSNDNELKKLALNILSEIDIDKNLEKFKLIFGLYSTPIRDVSWNIEAKTLIERLSKKHVHLGSQPFSFWMKISIENPDNEYVTLVFSKWLAISAGSDFNKLYKIVEA